MTELITAPIIAIAVYFMLKKVEKTGYEQGYDDGFNDRRPKHKIRIGFNPQQHDKR